MNEYAREQIEAQMHRQLQEVEDHEIEQLLKFFVSPEDFNYDDGDQVLVQRLQAELLDLKTLIDDLHVAQIPQVRRFGLPIFAHELLMQFYMYVDGLHSLNVIRQPQVSLIKLAQAIMRPKILCHQIGKKVLLLMTEILKNREEQQKEQLKNGID